MLADVLQNIFNLLQGTFINIPINNDQGLLYVILNFFLLLFATFTGTSTGL